MMCQIRKNIYVRINYVQTLYLCICIGPESKALLTVAIRRTFETCRYFTSRLNYV